MSGLGVNAWLTARAVEGYLEQNKARTGSEVLAIPFTIFEWRDILTALNEASPTDPRNDSNIEHLVEREMAYRLVKRLRGAAMAVRSPYTPTVNGPMLLTVPPELLDEAADAIVELAP